MKKYSITLAEDERETLGEHTSNDNHTSQKILSALMLFGYDEGGFQIKRSTNEEIARMLNTSMRKIKRVKKRFVMVKNTERKTKVGWACFIEEIAGKYESAEKITLVMDNLNTHNPGSLYEVFPPDKAKVLWARFEFVYTPKHGSWLNMAEIELDVLTGQCLNRRIDDIEIVRNEVAAWQKFRNNKNAKVNWQFTTENARIKLSRLYQTLGI